MNSNRDKELDAGDADLNLEQVNQDGNSESPAPEHAIADLNLETEVQETCNQVGVVEQTVENSEGLFSKRKEEAIHTVEVERVETTGREVCPGDAVVFPTGGVQNGNDVPAVNSMIPSVNDIVSFPLRMKVEHVR